MEKHGSTHGEISGYFSMGAKMEMESREHGLRSLFFV